MLATFEEPRNEIVAENIAFLLHCRGGGSAAAEFQMESKMPEMQNVQFACEDFRRSWTPLFLPQILSGVSNFRYGLERLLVVQKTKENNTRLARALHFAQTALQK